MIRTVSQSMTGWHVQLVRGLLMTLPVSGVVGGEERVALPEDDVSMMTDPPVVDIQDDILKIS